MGWNIGKISRPITVFWQFRTKKPTTQGTKSTTISNQTSSTSIKEIDWDLDERNLNGSYGAT